MKLKKGIMIHETPDGLVAVATGDAAKGFNGMLRLSETAAFIVRALQSETTAEAVAGLIVEKYDVDVATATADVNRLVAQLSDAGLMA